MMAQFKTEWWLKSSGQVAQSGADYSIAKIYNIIKMILPKDYSEMVIKKIQEELSK